MPYTIRFVKSSDKPYKIVNLDRNEVVGSSESRGKAEASIRARLAGEHGVRFKKRRKRGGK